MKNIERLAKVFFRELQTKIEKAKETKPSPTQTKTPGGWTILKTNSTKKNDNGKQKN